MFAITVIIVVIIIIIIAVEVLSLQLNYSDLMLIDCDHYSFEFSKCSSTHWEFYREYL